MSQIKVAPDQAPNVLLLFSVCASVSGSPASKSKVNTARSTSLRVVGSFIDFSDFRLFILNACITGCGLNV